MLSKSFLWKNSILGVSEMLCSSIKRSNPVFVKRAFSAVSPKSATILFGSEMGTTEGAAKQLQDDLSIRGIRSNIVAMNDLEMKEIPSLETVFCLISTAGDGEFPSNSKEFYDRLCNQSNTQLFKGIRFSVFGLGDSHFTHFNVAAKQIYSKLKELGGEPLTDVFLGNDRDPERYETQYYNWTPELFRVLNCETITSNSPPQPNYSVTLTDSLPQDSKLKEFKPAHSYRIQLVSVERLTTEDYDRDIRHMELDISNTRMRYEVCDTLAIYHQNPVEKVQQFLNQYHMDPHQYVSIVKDESVRRSILPTMTTVSTLFSEVLDVFGPVNRRFLSVLSRFAKDESQRRELQLLMSFGGSEQLKHILQEHTSYADILMKYNSCRPSLEYLIDMIPTVKPRLYSIASSPLMHPKQIHLCVVGVDFKTPSGVEVHGQCTEYLRSLSVSPSAVGSSSSSSTTSSPSSSATTTTTTTKSKSKSSGSSKSQGPLILAAVNSGTMHLPETTTTPIIMAGLGTGISPLKAITEHRVSQARKGEKVGGNALFYGCRYRKEFVYEGLWKKYHEEGVLTHVIPAYSREQAHKVYIQDKIVENSAMVVDYLINQSGYYYYCGLAGKPPQQIREGIIKAIHKEKGWSEEKADSYIETMIKEGRYNMEGW